MRDLPAAAPGAHGVFSAVAAKAGGWSQRGLDCAVRADRLVRVVPGWYAPAQLWRGDAPDDQRRRLAMRTVAALGSVADSVATGASSAVLAGLPLWTTPTMPCLTVAPGSTTSARSAHLHRAALPPDQVVGGLVPRTSSARAVVDLARERGVDEAVVLGDAALRKRMTDAARLSAALGLCRGWPGTAAAQEALSLLDGRAESPAESMSRLRLRSWLPVAPDLQTVIVSLDGHHLGRLDFYWDEFGVGGEVDGRLKYRDHPDAVFYTEKRRQERLEDTGLVMVRWGVADLDPRRGLRSRLESAFARGCRLPRSERRWRIRQTPQLRA